MGIYTIDWSHVWILFLFLYTFKIIMYLLDPVTDDNKTLLDNTIILAIITSLAVHAVLLAYGYHG